MSTGFRLVEHADLGARNSFHLPASAPLLAELLALEALPVLLETPALQDRPLLVLGGGSNLLFAADPDAVVIAITARGVSIVERCPDNAIVRAEAGLGWHALVAWTLDQGLSGLENLALIPGTVGAAPIQNIGAYGVEIKDSIHAVESLDRETGQIQRRDRQQCAFGYRDSVFKQQPDRHIVMAVEFALPLVPRLRLDYAGIGDELASMRIDHPTPRDVADAVCALRRRKLPDPDRIGNAGSFFKNPIIPLAQLDPLRAAHAALPVYPGRDASTAKLSAAWLIEQCGWKGYRGVDGAIDVDAGVAGQHALVVVNHGKASGAGLLALARAIAASVQQRFGVAIEPEPRIVGAAW